MFGVNAAPLRLTTKGYVYEFLYKWFRSFTSYFWLTPTLQTCEQQVYLLRLREKSISRTQGSRTRRYAVLPDWRNEKKNCRQFLLDAGYAQFQSLRLKRRQSVKQLNIHTAPRIVNKHKMQTTARHTVALEQKEGKFSSSRYSLTNKQHTLSQRKQIEKAYAQQQPAQFVTDPKFAPTCAAPFHNAKWLVRCPEHRFRRVRRRACGVSLRLWNDPCLCRCLSPSKENAGISNKTMT